MKTLFLIFLFVSNISLAQRETYYADYYVCNGKKTYSDLELHIDSYSRTAWMSVYGDRTVFKILSVEEGINTVRYSMQNEDGQAWYDVAIGRDWIVIEYPYYFRGLCKVVRYKLIYKNYR